MAVKNPTQLDFVLVNGDFEVHKHGCRDITRAIKNKLTDYAEPGIINVDPTDDFNDVIRFLWDDQIAESYDYADDPDQENAILVPAQPATEDAAATDDSYLPSPAWLAEHAYLSATHFNPCIKQWVRVTEAMCEGAGKEWKGIATTKANDLECPECGSTAGFLGAAPRKRNGKWRPLVPQHQVEVEEVFTPETAPAKSTSKGTGGTSKADAKRLLATHVALAIGELVARISDENLAGDDQDVADFRAIAANFTKDEMLVVATTWIHHIPADRERWVAAGLPKPDRSDWR